MRRDHLRDQRTHTGNIKMDKYNDMVLTETFSIKGRCRAPVNTLNFQKRREFVDY